MRLIVLLEPEFQEENRVRIPPGLDWVELIEYYAFRLALLASFLYTLFKVIKHELRD